jgi:hypothetical protein
LNVTGIYIAGRTIAPVIAIGDPCRKAAPVAGAIESAQVGIHVVGIGPIALHDNGAASIVWVIKIRVVTGVPEEVAVPSQVGVSESKAQPIRKTIPIHGIAISESHSIIRADRCGRVIIGIVCIVIVEIGPAGLILGFQTHVVIAGSGAVIVSPVAGAGAIVSAVLIIICCGSPGSTGRIIDIVRGLRGFPGRGAAAEQDKAGSQDGKCMVTWCHGESI